MSVLGRYIAAALLPFFAVLHLNSCSKGGYIAVTGYAQGGVYSVKLSLDGSQGRVRLTPEEIKSGIDSVIIAVDKSLSGYDKSSLLSRFNAGESIVPDDIFKDIYRISRHYYDETGGCFDVSAAPLFDIWGFGFTSDSLPSPVEVSNVLKNIGMGRLYDTLVLDSSGRTSSSLLLRGTVGRDTCAVAGKPELPELNFNAIAQGYTCDLVAGYLHSIGVDRMLVDIGGEIYCEGLNPSGQRWSIGLDRPEDGNNVPGQNLQGVFRAGPEPCGVVTSGNYRKYYIKDGRKYAHTIDPRTGYPVTHSLLCATVVAENATEADALATYCMVIGFEKSREFIGSRPDLEACLVYEQDGQMKTWTSDGLGFEER